MVECLTNHLGGLTRAIIYSTQAVTSEFMVPVLYVGACFHINGSYITGLGLV